MRRVLIIARREYLSFLKTPGFWISLAVMPVVGFFFAQAPKMVERSVPAPVVVMLDLTGPAPAGVTRPGEAVRAFLASPEGRTAEPELDRRSMKVRAAATGKAQADLAPLPPDLASVTDAKTAEGPIRRYLTTDARLPDGRKLSAAVILTGDEKALKVDVWTPNPEIVGLSSVLEAPLSRWTREARLARAGLDPNLARRLDASPPDFRSFSPKAEAGLVSWKDRLPTLASAGLSFILWSLVMTSAGILLNTVIEEKANRVMEVLLSSASVGEILGGKVLGGMALSFSMVLVWGAGGGWLAYRASPEFVQAFLAALMAHGLVFWFLGLFVSGYLMYAVIFAAIGSFCETPREAQTLLGPVMLVLMAPILFLASAVSHPDAPILRLLSFVPLFTPFLMMVRVAVGAPLQDLIGAMAGMAVTVMAVIALAGRAFQAGALAAEKPDLKRLFALIRER